MADRVVGDRGEVDDGVKAVEVLGAGIANVAGPLLVPVRLRAEVAAVVPADVEADDLVSGRLQEWDQHGADVTAVTGDEHSHIQFL